MTLGSGFAIRRVAETGSTNSDLLAEVRAAEAAGAPFAPRLLVADRQTAGRGRHGRRWHGEGGASLTFSLAWPFPASADLSGLSLAVGVALADALDPPPAANASAAVPRIGLKWPNDLCLVDAADARDSIAVGRKLAGILVETTPLGVDWRIAVVGVGINVGAQAVADAANGVAWLAEIDAVATPASVLRSLSPGLPAALERFERDGFRAFAERYAARDLLRGRRVGGGEAGASLEGVAVGVSLQGELLLETAQGIVPVRSGEVRLRPLLPAEPQPC